MLVLWSQTATDEYIEREDARFQQAADLLLRGLAPAPEQAASSVLSSLTLGEQHKSLSGMGLCPQQMSHYTLAQTGMLHASKGTCLLVQDNPEGPVLVLGVVKDYHICCRMDVLLPTPLVGLECHGRLLWHAGSRRSILLVEAPRSADAPACSHVESVAAVVATLPDVAERCSFPQLPPGIPEPAGSSSCSLDTGQVRLPCCQSLAMRGVF